jgi:hypothetical protein
MLYTWHTTVTCLQSSLPTTRLGRVVGSMDGGSSTFLRVLPGRARAGEGSGPSSCRRRLSHRSVPVGQREAARAATARCSTWPPTSPVCRILPAAQPPLLPLLSNPITARSHRHACLCSASSSCSRPWP